MQQGTMETAYPKTIVSSSQHSAFFSVLNLKINIDLFPLVLDEN